MGQTQRKLAAKVILTVLMAALSISMLVPFVWMLSASFKPDNEVFDVPISWIPKTKTIANYVKVWGSTVPFATFFRNSIVVSTWCVAGEVFTSALAGYAFAKIRFRGRNILFWTYVATLIFPGQMMLIPRFVLFRLTGLYNTLWALILPGMFTAFGTFMLRQFFSTIPEELSESAKIDGANHFDGLQQDRGPAGDPGLQRADHLPVRGHVERIRGAPRLHPEPGSSPRFRWA